jgi:hypothetical protein
MVYKLPLPGSPLVSPGLHPYPKPVNEFSSPLEPFFFFFSFLHARAYFSSFFQLASQVTFFLSTFNTFLSTNPFIFYLLPLLSQVTPPSNSSLNDQNQITINMPSQKFCFCIPVRFGVFVLSFWSLIASGLCSGLGWAIIAKG